MLDKTQVANFRVKNREFEVFFSQDGAVELYDKDNPRDGFIFSDRKNLVMFINTLSDVIEKKQMENDWEK